MTLTTFPHDPLLDLDPWVGQRQATFRFALSDFISGEVLGDIHPIRNASLTHDTTRTIKRQLNISLGVADTAAINPISERIDVFMVFPSGVEYPLGRYMFTDASRQVFTSGKLGQMALNDEMFLVDQQVTVGINGVDKNVATVIAKVLEGLPITYTLPATEYLCAEAWGLGTTRGQMLESLSVTGDYFSPWFGNDGVMHFIRSFDPSTAVADFNFDAGNKVMRDAILESDDLLIAPNTFIVVSNAAEDPSEEVVGQYDIPPTAPHSFARRGFTIAQVENLQLSTVQQARAVAQNLGIRQTIFERVSLTTAPDPRHDAYNVVVWQGEKWLELAWSMALVEGGNMSHLLRKSYSP